MNLNENVVYCSMTCELTGLALYRMDPCQVSSKKQKRWENEKKGDRVRKIGCFFYIAELMGGVTQDASPTVLCGAPYVVISATHRSLPSSE